MATLGKHHYVIIGGGIAGVSCAEELAQLAPDDDVTVISNSPLIKAAINITQQSRVLETFDVEERQASYLEQTYSNVTVRLARVTCIRAQDKVVEYSDGSSVHYDKLCVCTGAQPKLIALHHPLVVGIRDTESVKDFQKKLSGAKRVMVVGNGGIATELVYEVSCCEVIWAIRHSNICHTFVDEGASVFFLPHLSQDETVSTDQKAIKRTKYQMESTRLVAERGKEEEEEEEVEKKRKGKIKESVMKEGEDGEERGAGGGGGGGGGAKSSSLGSALGPDWHSGKSMTGACKQKQGSRSVHVEYECEVECLLTAEEVVARQLEITEPPSLPSSAGREGVEGEKKLRWPVYVLLTNGRVFGCDVIVSATGAQPCTGCLVGKNGEIELALAEDGGVVVDNEMRSSLPDVYAAGDVCTVQWPSPPQLWFQMRLWTQGRQMGAYAARAMLAHTWKEEISLDFCFEVFAHITKFFGFKVVLLGLYNGQGLKEYEVILRCTKGVEYVKVVLCDGKMVGAILIGETDLEETFENLILNQMDLSALGESLLDPRVDIEDFFD